MYKWLIYFRRLRWLVLWYFCMGDPLTTANKRLRIRVIRRMTTNSKKWVKWRSYFLRDSLIKTCLLSSWIVKSVLFSQWIVTRVVFFPVPFDMEIQIRRNGKGRCVQVASIEQNLIHIVWRMEASNTQTQIRTWGNRVYRMFGRSICFLVALI